MNQFPIWDSLEPTIFLRFDDPTDGFQPIWKTYYSNMDHLYNFQLGAKIPNKQYVKPPPSYSTPLLFLNGLVKSQFLNWTRSRTHLAVKRMLKLVWNLSNGTGVRSKCNKKGRNGKYQPKREGLSRPYNVYIKIAIYIIYIYVWYVWLCMCI